MIDHEIDPKIAEKQAEFEAARVMLACCLNLACGEFSQALG